jgi:hypothetical protein
MIILMLLRLHILKECVSKNNVLRFVATGDKVAGKTIVKS